MAATTGVKKLLIKTPTTGPEVGRMKKIDSLIRLIH
jgi:hypothetical protein